MTMWLMMMMMSLLVAIVAFVVCMYEYVSQWCWPLMLVKWLQIENVWMTCKRDNCCLFVKFENQYNKFVFKRQQQQLQHKPLASDYIENLF